MAVDVFVSHEFHAYLIAQGVGQDGNATPSTTIPSIWLQPDAPRPRKQGGTWLENATITLVPVVISGPPGLEDQLEEAFVEVRVRAVKMPTAMLIHRVIKGLIVPEGANGGQRQLWTMNTLLVEYSRIWRGEQDVPSAPDDEDRVYTRTASYCFGCRRKALRGLPYAD